MNLKDEFLTAWKAGEDHDTLLQLVHRHQEHGLSAHDAYGVLHQLWLHFGFNNAANVSALQDNLEYVLEKVWYECPAAK